MYRQDFSAMAVVAMVVAVVAVVVAASESTAVCTRLSLDFSSARY
jgi:hypothetical protein